MQPTDLEIAGTTLLENVAASLRAGDDGAVQEQLADTHDAEAANLLESLPPDARSRVWALLPAAREGEVLAYLHDEARTTIIEGMAPRELVAAAESMDVEDLAEVIEDLPDSLTEVVLDALDRDHRLRVEQVLSFPEDTAGRLMSTDTVSVRADVTLAVVLRWLRRHATLPPHTDALMVIDADGQYLGRLPLSDVVTGDPGMLVASVMQGNADAVGATTGEHEVAALFERRDLVSVAVLDKAGHLLGRITIDDVVDVIREQADYVLLRQAGLDEEEDLFAPVWSSARRRGVWLGINLITVFLAAWVIGRFEEALRQLVALAVLMPVVASMGGIAGSQTLTLTIRGMALGQIGASNVWWLTAKEAAVGALNGLTWAVVVALVAYLWFRDVGLSAVIAVAMLLNLVVAAVCGVSIPLLLRRCGVDPALSGAVILTTVTDVLGFLSFLGLATILLL